MGRLAMMRPGLTDVVGLLCAAAYGEVASRSKARSQPGNVTGS